MNHDYQYTPKNGFSKWLDKRLPLMRFADENLLSFPTPKNLNYFYTFGFILTMCLVTQIITGIVLAMHYVPNTSLAFDSIEHIMRDVNYGWLIRYMHSNGASMFFLAVFIHMFRGLYYGSYKEPREIIWILGVVIFLLMIITGFMGYVLPWGQMSFWGATVITNLVATIPVIGEPVLTLLLGGYSVDNPTLNRFFSLHYLLPFVIFGVVILHIWALHVTGNNNPTGIEVKDSKDTISFHPYYTVKDLFSYVVFLLMFCYFIFYNPNILGHPDNYIEADPMLTPAHIVPEWYLLPFYAILRAVPDKLMGVLLMFGSIIVLFFLPWLDTMKVKSARYRPLYKIFFLLFVIFCLLLGYLGAKPPEGIYLLLSRVSTIYYFAFFLVIMPILSRIEKPLPMPIGISNPAINNNSDRSGGVSGSPSYAMDSK
ncbi:MAG: cytochrome b/b6 [Rhizobiales bacterium TMED94]|nr:cytochrome b [Rhodobiaceae bacterium]RPF86882.1 MAG: cytochrome b/b6 [Rhizobiales bacterium TMED94]|tara:strand:+ start:1401 stop:2678 length:1278 start_codon:yes stop_codon:yes gene_type:complete